MNFIFLYIIALTFHLIAFGMYILVWDGYSLNYVNNFSSLAINVTHT